MAGRNKIANLVSAGAGAGAPISGLTESGASVNISSRELTLMLKLTTTVIGENGWKIKYYSIFIELP